MLINRKILLVHPVLKGRRLQATPDLGLGFIGATLRREGYEVEILDCVCKKWSVEDFSAYVKLHEFGMVGFKVFSLDLDSVRRMARAVKDAQPKTLVVLGGPHPSCSPHDVLNTFPEADYAFQGEGETGIAMLLRRLKENAPNKTFEGIPGIVYREDGEVCVHPAQPVHNLDELGIPAWDLIDPRAYAHTLGLWPVTKNRIVAPLHLTRGCPYSCGFCAARAISGNTFRLRSLELVMKELRMLSEEYGIREFHLIDDMVTGDREYLMRFCAALKQANLGLDWACPMGLRLDSLDAELLHAMEDAGCYGASVGVESGSQRILDFIDKGTTVEALRRNTSLLRKETNWMLVGLFIIGLPTETREEMEQTIQFACSLPLDAVQFSAFMPLRGTPLYKYITQESDEEKEGERPPLECGDIFVRYYAPDGLGKKEITLLLRKAHWKFFLVKPARIFRIVRIVNRPWHIPRLAKVVRMRMLDSRGMRKN